MKNVTLSGYATSTEAHAADTTSSGYRVEVIDLSQPHIGGTGFALLARSGHSSSSPLGAYDVRLHLPDRLVDSHAEVCEILGVRS